MAYHYIIDGYNLLYALPEMPPGSWEEKRRQLLDFLRRERPQGNNRLTVVFDSRQGLGDQNQTHDVTVIFTAGETADERIGEMVRQNPHPRALVVVSNDQGIHTLVRGTGARFITTTDFLKTAPPSTPPKTSEKHKPHAAEDITEELKKKWL